MCICTRVHHVTPYHITPSLPPPQQLLDARNNIKIIDFGLSNVMREGYFLKTSCGSFNYAAPEVIKGCRYAGPEVDVWSSGVVLYALLCGVLPFNDDMQQGIPYVLRKILAGTYSVPHFVSPQAQDLISRMLKVDPLQRITVTEIKCVWCGCVQGVYMMVGWVGVCARGIDLHHHAYYPPPDFPHVCPPTPPTGSTHGFAATSPAMWQWWMRQGSQQIGLVQQQWMKLPLHRHR